MNPIYPKRRNTAYYWVLDLAIRNYYGVNGLSASTYRELSDKIREEYRPGIYQRIVREAAGIEKAITDHCDRQKAEDYADQALIFPTWKIDPWIYIRGKGDLENISKESKMDVTSISAIRSAFGAILEMRRKSGIVAAKCGSAYDRTLEFKFVSDQDAQRALDTLLKGDDPAAARVLQDYIFHVVVQACTDNNIPIQIHTGLLGRSNYGNLARTNPMLLAEYLRTILRPSLMCSMRVIRGCERWGHLEELILPFMRICAGLNSFVPLQRNRLWMNGWIPCRPPRYLLLGVTTGFQRVVTVTASSRGPISVKSLQIGLNEAG